MPEKNVKFFLAADGPHFAVVDGSLVALGMRDVFDLKNVGANDYVTNTGSHTM